MPDRLRIALYHNLPSGGAKRAVYETTRRLAARHHVDLFSPEIADTSFCDIRPLVNRVSTYPYRELRRYGRPFGRLNPLIHLLDLYRMGKLSQKMARDIDSAGYDVVSLHSCRITQAPSILRSLQTPNVYYCHEGLRVLYEPRIPRPYWRQNGLRRAADRLDPIRASHRMAWRRIDRANLRAASLVLCNSRYSRENIQRIYGVSARVCRLGVDVERFHPTGSPKRRYVVSAGAIKPEKGYDFLISSLGSIPTYDRPPLVVVGNAESPEERAYLTDLATRAEVEVEFRIDIPDEELVRLYNEAPLMAYAPVREPLGLTSLEAQACGTPVVGVREGGVTETIVDQLTGLLVEREPRRFGEAIASLLRAPGRAEEYGRNARAFVERDWTWESSAEWMEGALLETSSSRRREPRLSVPAAPGE
jgi:glycosyltransferase involved in cell wall biosynthesis